MLEVQSATTPRRERLFQLIAELRRVRAELKEAEASDTSFFFSDRANDTAISALKKEKNRIAEEIRVLELEPDVPATKPATRAKDKSEAK